MPKLRVKTLTWEHPSPLRHEKKGPAPCHTGSTADRTPWSSNAQTHKGEKARGCAGVRNERDASTYWVHNTLFLSVYSNFYLQSTDKST